MTTIALLAGFGGDDAIVAWRRGAPVSMRAFLADVAALAARLPDRGHVLNVAADRYRFAVGLAAAMVRGQVSLLPPSTHGETVAQLARRFPDAYCLAERAEAAIDLPQTFVDADGTRNGPSCDVPTVPVRQTVAYVFTSGSTGTPVLHAKRWGSLVTNVRAEASRLRGLAEGSIDRSAAIVATVPAQHMYGFESSLLMAWQGGHAFVAERPFYPADVATALARLPSPRLLVTTPFHLRAIVDERITLPAVACFVSATAPLAAALARDVELRFAAPLVEIYGCTETGQLATRRPTVAVEWRPFGDVRVALVDGRAIASGGHIEEPTALADVVELVDDDGSEGDDRAQGRFRLAGRSADLVNVAGKRTSLGHLDLQLNAIDGVVDGVFVAPDEPGDGRVARLAAVVVAPTLDAAALLAALRTRIDAVFLPRPIHFVDRIPRNDVGKLTRSALATMLAGLTHAAARDASHDEQRDERRMRTR